MEIFVFAVLSEHQIEVEYSQSKYNFYFMELKLTDTEKKR